MLISTYLVRLSTHVSVERSGRLIIIYWWILLNCFMQFQDLLVGSKPKFYKVCISVWIKKRWAAISQYVCRGIAVPQMCISGLPSYQNYSLQKGSKTMNSFTL
jgi:hypothetical protein